MGWCWSRTKWKNLLLPQLLCLDSTYWTCLNIICILLFIIQSCCLPVYCWLGIKIIIVSLINVAANSLLAKALFRIGWILNFFVITSTVISMLMTVNLSIDFSAYATSWLWASELLLLLLKEARRLRLLQITGNNNKTNALTLSLCAGALCVISEESRLCSWQRIKGGEEGKWVGTMATCSVACSYPETPSHVDPEFM